MEPAGHPVGVAFGSHSSPASFFPSPHHGQELFTQYSLLQLTHVVLHSAVLSQGLQVGEQLGEESLQGSQEGSFC